MGTVLREKEGEGTHLFFSHQSSQTQGFLLLLRSAGPQHYFSHTYYRASAQADHQLEVSAFPLLSPAPLMMRSSYSTPHLLANSAWSPACIQSHHLYT